MITLLTCTGDRHELFARQERWMQRQTLPYDRWIVVDDGLEPTVPTLGQEYIRREPNADPKASFAMNMRAGLSAINLQIPNGLPVVTNLSPPQKVFIVEDDDWYGPRYLETLAPALDQVELVGERHCHYYHVGARVWKLCPNTNHASLCQTAFRSSLIPQIERLTCTQFALLDIRSWYEIDCSRRLFDTAHCVGLKGQKGRPGITTAHTPDGTFNSDPEGLKLVEWVGEQDAKEIFGG